MGWLFGWRTKQALVASLKTDFAGSNCNLIDHAVVGNTFYALADHKDPAGNPNPKFIVVVLLQYVRGAGGWSTIDNGANDWGYKDMDESAGPYVYACPQRILDASELDHPTAVEWRKHCREWQAAEKARREFVAGLKTGDVFYVRDQKVICEHRPGSRYNRNFVLGYAEDGELYRWKKNNITQHPPKDT